MTGIVPPLGGGSTTVVVEVDDVVVDDGVVVDPWVVVVDPWVVVVDACVVVVVAWVLVVVDERVVVVLVQRREMSVAFWPATLSAAGQWTSQVLPVVMFRWVTAAVATAAPTMRATSATALPATARFLRKAKRARLCRRMRCWGTRLGARHAAKSLVGHHFPLIPPPPVPQVEGRQDFCAMARSGSRESAKRAGSLRVPRRG
jgi:hypothetical protein